MLSPGDDTPLPFAFPPPPTFQVTIDDWNLIFYSMIYTAVPCMTYGVFEQVVLPLPPMLTPLACAPPLPCVLISPPSLPPLLLLLLLGCAREQPAPPEMLLRHPAAYRGGPACAAYNGRSFLLAMADTIWQVPSIPLTNLQLQPKPDGRACVASHGPPMASHMRITTAGGRDLLRAGARLRAVPRRRAA